MQMDLDHFFQEQNEQFTIDTSKQNVHWQQMQKQLVVTPTTNRNWKPFAIATILIALSTALFLFINTKKESSSIAQKENTSKQQIPLSNNEAASTESKAMVEDKTITTIPIYPKLSIPITEKQVIDPANRSLTTPVIATAIIQKKAQFYIDLSKEPEIFELDPSTENTITCKQGTKLTIPANSIVDVHGNTPTEKISFIVQEYYRYDGKIEDNGNKAATAGMLKYEVYKDGEKLNVVTGKTVVITMHNGLQNLKVIASEDALSEKQLQQLNWISNERFYTDKRTKIDYKITLDAKYDANTFMSQIAFPKYNALLPGNIENNSLIFTNIPVGENIYFISLGKIGDKYFSCSKKLISGNTSIKEMDFVEISEALYKQQIDMYGKLGKND
jgi:hypothetical protein